MANLQDWLENKYQEWIKKQGGNPSYYAFARYLDVGHSAYAQWSAGVSQPVGDDLAKLAGKLGAEVYDLVNQPRPGGRALFGPDFALLPSAFQTRLSNAITETARALTQNQLDPESVEAKRTAAKIFEKWGFKLTG
jgi:transcriptional regulator with XRE-family HTH domain